jgi:hypothetical protein
VWRSLPVNQQIIERIMELSNNEITKLWGLSHRFSRVAVQAFEKNIPKEDENGNITNAEIAACHDLRAALCDGRYIGIGFPEPKRFGDFAVLIPRDAWLPDPTGFQLLIGPDILGRWSYGDHSFCEVRIANSAKHIIKTGGRDTLQFIFKDVLDQMVENDEIDTSKTQVAHFVAIRERATALYPMHKVKIQGSVNRVISKYLSPIYNKLKDNKE